MDSDVNGVAGDTLGDGHGGYEDMETATEPTETPLPRFLRDISSLASWTVSSSKPGCGVYELRKPSPDYFWQSDGPQPHTLNIHFFKRVSIAYVRIYLDHSLDESYTPTKMLFLAGTGHHDLQPVCEMNLEKPKGWLSVDLSSAGGPPVLEGDDDEDSLDGNTSDEDSDEEDDIRAQRHARRALRRQIASGPTLRCFLVQLQILENHQNGKDTHLRGLQIFAKDEAYHRGNNAVNRAGREMRGPRLNQSLGTGDNGDEGSGDEEMPETTPAPPPPPRSGAVRDPTEGIVGVRLPDFMGEPELR